MEDKKVLLIDMDEVLADFSGFFRSRDYKKYKYNPPEMYEKDFFKDLIPVRGSLEAIRRLIQSEKFDIWICTQPVSVSPLSYMEKAQWIWSWLPELGHKIIMTQDKNMVKCDYLIDDNTKWGVDCSGEFIHFKTDEHPKKMWRDIVEYLTKTPYYNTEETIHE